MLNRHLVIKIDIYNVYALCGLKDQCLAIEYLVNLFFSLRKNLSKQSLLLILCCCLLLVRLDGYKLTWGSAKQRQQLITVLQTALGALKQSLLVSGKR